MTDPVLRRVTRLVGLLNLSYFGIEFAIALAIGSVSLFADSVDSSKMHRSISSSSRLWNGASADAPSLACC
jgi:Co/Zn/Cd efflux system component